MKKLAIIGAGYSGISAAIHLDKDKFDISIFEQRPSLGGRASSFYDKETKSYLDNGQHMLMHCYHSTFEIFDTLKVHRSEFYIAEKMSVAYLSSKFGKYYFKSVKHLPAPLHLSLSILFDLKPLKFIEKLSLIKAFLQLKLSKKYDKLTLDKTLIRLKQSSNTIKYIWKPILVSIFNDDAKQISTAEFRNVMTILFFKKNNHANVVLSKKPLSILLEKPFENYCLSKNIKLNLSNRIKAINIESNSVNDMSFDIILSTIPLYQLNKLLPINLDGYSIKSIVTIYFTYDGDLFDDPFLGLPESKLHWIFNLSKINHDNINIYSVVISNADEYFNDKRDDFKRLLISELKYYFKQFELFKFKYIRTVHEKKASYNASLKHNVGKFKNNFYICGDWTNTKLPSTIESAALSGKKIAEQLNNL